MRVSQTRTEHNPLLQAFLLGLVTAAAIFLPYVVMDNGYFIYYGDFNVQQIPFYQLAHESIRGGDVLWNWYTDLGANFIGSYSFYLLFSPFFWLTLLFPTSALPFLMAPLLILKTACASFTACLYLRRFVKNTDYAVLGSLLYAFSGWMDFNIFFNHFHEAAVFFPLLLLGVEKLVTENNKGFFAAAVAMNAIVNYWFFVGEAVFVVIYVFVRMSDKSWRMSALKFFRLFCEAVLGVGMAAAVLLPSVMALTGNPRTGLSELTTGWNAWLFWHEQRQPAILASLLFPPDLPARTNLFPDHGAKWASLSAWLPLFGVTGVLAYFFARKHDWLKKMLALCLLFSLVPWLNSLFILLNDSYYARWFYMPVLLMALATARAMEDSASGTAHWFRSVKWCGILLAAFTLMCGVTPEMDEEEGLFFGLAKDMQLFWIYALIAVLCLAVTALLMLHFRYRKRFVSAAIVMTAVFSAGFAIFYIASGKNVFERSDFVINTAIGGREQISLPADTFARSDAYDAQDNLLMFWHLPNIQAFHSIVPASIMEFYPEVGVTRDVGSRPEPDFAALRPLLSVRWLFIGADKEKQSPMPGYVPYATQAGFNVYENENFIPIGFSYDEAITREDLEEVEKKKRSNMMLKAVVLEPDAIARNRDILTEIKPTGYEDFSDDAMTGDAAARRAFTADSFSFDTRGFTAATSFDEDRLVFFSVPWESGWTASVNGVPARIERANIGFMAVRVPKGDSVIRFDYFTPGLIAGAVISAASLAVFLVYVLIALVLRVRAKRREPSFETAIMNGIPVEMSIDEYLSRFGDKEQRRARLQRTLNEAAASHMPDKLDAADQTFKFSSEPDKKGNDGDHNR